MAYNEWLELQNVVDSLTECHGNLISKLVQESPKAAGLLWGLLELWKIQVRNQASGEFSDTEGVDQAIKALIDQIAEVESDAPVADLMKLWEHTTSMVTLLVKLAG